MKQLLFFCCIFFTTLLSAQRDLICAPDCRRVFIGASGQYGFLWSHRYNMGHLVKKHIGSVELDFSLSEPKSSCWRDPYHYPTTGVALHYIPLGNPDQLGVAVGLYPYINFPLGKYDHRLKANMRLGWGIGYVQKSFDPVYNHKNIALGSHLNTCFSLRLNGMYRIDPDDYLELGLGITHFSNGAYRLPNLGINLPMLVLGYHHAIEKQVCEKYSDAHIAKMAATDSLIQDRHWHFAVIAVLGQNDIQPPGGNHWGVCNVLTYFMKQTARKSRWGAGIDVMYSQGLRHILTVDDTLNVSVIGNLQPGAKFVYELVLGRISFPMEMGVYLYTKYTDNGPVYNRWAVHYLVNKHLLLDFSLKTHFAKAEYFELGAGWRF